MSSGLAISAFMPSITSSGIFSSRRANSGVDAMAANNPFVGAMNLDIAGGQVLNAAKGAANIAKESKNSVAAGIISAEESIKTMAKGDKVLRGIGKVMNFTANNINPIICATGALKVVCSDDKVDAGIREGMALTTMFGAEALAKRVFGMPKIQNIDGKRVAVAREGWYKKNPFAEKQAAAFKDYCQTAKICNKSLKFLPGMTKGLGFALASIFGYKLGLSAADMILDKGKNHTV